MGPYMPELTITHKVLSVEHHSVCPLVGIGSPPTPLPQASVPSPRTKGWGGGTHSPANLGSAGLRGRLGLRVPYPKFLFEYSLGAPPLLQYKFLVPDWGG